MSSTKSVALWVEPEPATRSERIVATSTVSLLGVALVLSIGHLMLPTSGLVLVHASLGEDALRPRAVVVLSSVIGGIGALLALARGYFLMFGLLYSEEEWRTSAVLALAVLSIVPFTLPFAAGIILLRNDFEPVKWRVRAVSIAVGVAALVIALAAMIPRWARLAEMGVW
jgi:hypothetical protein